MDIRQAEIHHQRIDRINAAIRETSRFVDRQAYCDVEGEKKLYTLEQLTKMVEAEEQALRDLAAA